jgi:ferredoxin--NADP+ reductase
VIGQGNVAVDVARILAKTTDELKQTDITAQALEVLAESKLREIHMVGRRGPVQAAFTPVELKELGELEDADVVVDPQDLELNQASQSEIDVLKWRDARKNLEILREFAARPAAGKSRRLVIPFYRSPKEFRGHELVLERNTLAGEAGAQRAVGSGQVETVACGALFRSVGYRGVPIVGVPFDERAGIIPNVEGRVMSEGAPLSGFYVVGWIKRGPSGVIGTNKPDASETVKHLLADAPALFTALEPARAAVLDLLASRGVRVVSYAQWRAIDAAEVARGAAAGKPREKFVDVDEMLSAAARS